MNYENFKYIICDENKSPLHSFDVNYSFNKVHDKENLAILMEEPYVIFDLDDDGEFYALYNMLEKLNIKTRIMKTSRGGHFWFRSLQPMTNVVHSNTPVTLKVDIKCWGKRTMEVIKRNGEFRKWLRWDETIDEVPFFLRPIKINKNLMGMTDGDGRNDALFTYIMPLLNERFNKQEVKQIFQLINEFLFTEPLTQSELDAMIDNNPIFTNISTMFYKGTSFQHNIFADYIIHEHHCKCYGGEIYFYDDERNVYTSNNDLLMAKMVEIIPAIKRNNLREAFDNIKFKVIAKPVKINTNYLNLDNGLFDIKNQMLIEHSPLIFTVNKIPCSYQPDLTCPAVDNVLSKTCCGDTSLIALLVQMLGYILIPDCRYQKSFIFLGGGSNGKSVILEMMRQFIGEHNCSSLALEDLSQRFRTSELVGKLLNIGDDSSHGLLENTAIFKKLVTGDTITVERKHENQFQFANTAKLIFAANSLPPTTDKSNGFFRRCIIIPFNAKFTPQDKDYDPCILDKLVTDDAKSYLLNLAIRGLSSLLKENKFIETGEILELSDSYVSNNNNVIMWYRTVSLKPFVSLADSFGSYIAFCATNNYKPISIGKFQQELDKLKKDQQ